MYKKSLLLIACFFSSVAYADLQQEVDGLCEKSKQCALKEMEAQNMPENVRKMMFATFDSVCDTMIKPYQKAIGEKGLEEKAEACLKSVNALSCDELSKKQDNGTPECVEFEAAADKAGIDFK